MTWRVSGASLVDDSGKTGVLCRRVSGASLVDDSGKTGVMCARVSGASHVVQSQAGERQHEKSKPKIVNRKIKIKTNTKYN